MSDLTVIILAQNEEKNIVRSVSSVKKIAKRIIVIDSAIVAEECDGAILVIEAGVISHRFAQEVKGQLDKTNCPVLGVVLNKVDMSRQKYYGKYYGRHYGRYYGKDE